MTKFCITGKKQSKGKENKRRETYYTGKQKLRKVKLGIRSL